MFKDGQPVPERAQLTTWDYPTTKQKLLDNANALLPEVAFPDKITLYNPENRDKGLGAQMDHLWKVMLSDVKRQDHAAYFSVSAAEPVNLRRHFEWTLKGKRDLLKDIELAKKQQLGNQAEELPPESLIICTRTARDVSDVSVKNTWPLVVADQQVVSRMSAVIVMTSNLTYAFVRTAETPYVTIEEATKLAEENISLDSFCRTQHLVQYTGGANDDFLVKV